MRRTLQKKALAGVLSFAMVLSSVSAITMGGTKVTAEDEPTVITGTLAAEDIDLRMTWNDTSNIGEGHSITLSNGDTITIKDNGSMRADMTAQKLADEEMGAGINLGNTMEAVYSVDGKKDATAKELEGAWGQPETTRAYIDKVHSYGINTLRIPVAWSNGDNDDGTYTIRGDFLDRVEEIANYALDNGMYVVINDHWDNQWWGQFGSCKKDADGNKIVNEEMRQAAWDRYESYWTQIAERFKDYSDHLIFEGANEELGDRLNDGIVINDCPAKGYCKPDNAQYKTEVVSGNLKTNELYEMVNAINQKFVDVVRSTGGNNKGRFLLIPGYNTNFQNTADDRFVMPEDTEENGKNKLFLSVHYYTPTQFCLDRPNGDYTTADQAATVEYFKDLKKFSDEGYGIILGECGVCEPSAVSGGVTQWFLDVFKECAKYHIVPVLWDNGAYFDRVTPAINYKDIAIFYNTINGTDGAIDTERETGGASGGGQTTYFTFPDYLDQKVWDNHGIQAYLSYQTTTWDYRDAYTPISGLSSGSHSWEYIHASGAEVTAENTTVTDVKLTENGEYTVAIDGIDLSGANAFNMLSVATNIPLEDYPNIAVTGASIKFDGVELEGGPFELIVKTDDKYYNFMVINRWDGKTPVEEYPLGVMNANENLTMPQKSIEITFTISGLDTILEEIEDGIYVNPDFGLVSMPKVTEEPEATEDPAAIPSSAPEPSNPATGGVTVAPVTTPPGDSVAVTNTTIGKYKYSLTKKADKATATVIGLTKKAKKAKKLTVPATVKSSDGTVYTINAIGKKAFSGAKAKAITLNKNIKVIPSQAFAKCKKLNTLTLKAKLTKVERNAFKGCKKKIKVKGTNKTANIKKLKKSGYKKFK